MIIRREFSPRRTRAGIIEAANTDTRTLTDGNRLFEEFKGTYAEQYVLQQLVGEYGSLQKSARVFAILQIGRMSGRSVLCT
jgi:hypothetical protein